MAIIFESFCKIALFLTLFSPIQYFSVQSREFEVGDDKGWVVPSYKNDQIYNQWASNHRFQVADTIRFKYKRDSVIVVTEKEYEKCHSLHPIFFSNNGDTVFVLDHPQLFYFISGIAGHCERGQKMIIKVLDPEILSPPRVVKQNGTTTTPTQGLTDHTSGAVSKNGIIALALCHVILSGLICLAFRYSMSSLVVIYN